MNSKSDTIVLVPAYNPDKGEITETINSLILQDFEVDILIIDDGSDIPVSLERDEKITILRQEINGGITVALNAGINYALSNGYKYLARLDVGDTSRKNRISKQRNALEENPDIDLLGAKSNTIDTEGNHLYYFGVSGADEVKSYLPKNAAFRHSSFMIRATSLKRFGAYDERYCGAEDYEMMLRFSKFGLVDCLEDILIDYVYDVKGISVRRRSNQLRMRLKAQLAHGKFYKIVWISGLFRTFATIALPSKYIPFLRKMAAKL